MSSMFDMMSTRLAAAVAPRTGKNIKNLLQNVILKFIIRLSQSSGIA